MKCISAMSLLVAAPLTWKLLIRRANKTTAWPASHGALLGNKAQLPEKTMRLRATSIGILTLKSNFKWKNTYLWNYLCPDCKVIAGLHAGNKYILNWWKLIKNYLPGYWHCDIQNQNKLFDTKIAYIFFHSVFSSLNVSWAIDLFIKKQARTITKWLYLNIWRMLWYLLHRTFFQDIFNISKLTQTQCTIFHVHSPLKSHPSGRGKCPFLPLTASFPFQCCSGKGQDFSWTSSK